MRYPPLETASNACLSIAGNSFPRAMARRSRPKHALALKKYSDGIGPVSKTCDNEHATAPLGQSEVLSVENSPRDPAPWSDNHTSVWPPSLAVRRDDGGVVACKRSKEAAEGIVA